MPNGVIYPAAKWIQMHPIAQNPDVKIVCGGGVANGKYFEIYDDFIQDYRDKGCDFEGCVTDEDFLEAIENFENSLYYGVEDITRLADALEDLVVLTMPDEN